MRFFVKSIRTPAAAAALGGLIAVGAASGAVAQAANPCAPKAASQSGNPCAPKAANPCSPKSQ